MTGYGRGEHSIDGAKVVVELKSVNRKQAEIVLRLPRELEPLEGRVRDEVNKVVARGRVEVQVALEQPGVAKAAKINPALAASYAAELRGLSEELARLDSHFVQFEECRRSAEPVGRKLDFLAQEMNREVNTIGSKANDALISADVVLLKTELERFREQAQNVE